MILLDLLQQSPTLLLVLVGIVGLLVGSFLNVVIYRLPVMMHRSWQKECTAYLASHANEQDSGGAPEDHELIKPEEEQEPFNLVLPLSRCPHCHTAIKPYHNIPVFSYLFLRGRCAYCQAPIAIRYPLIEALTGVCSVVVAWKLGFGAPLLWGLLLTWVLITLSFIDFDQQLLPDSITLPMLWLGLFLSEFTIFTPTDSSIIGAIAGYLSLWSVYQLFKLVTGKEGMGYGDFKLLAMLGAWLGWQFLPLIVLLSSLVGAVFGVSMIVFARHERGNPIPFGPYLAIAGWIALLWGGQLNALYLGLVGF